MSRPTDDPGFATSSTYSAGPYSGNANKATPSAGVLSEGFNPGAGIPAEWLNERLNNHGRWIKNIGANFELYDDFMGSSVSNLWTTAGTVSIGPPISGANGTGILGQLGSGTSSITSATMDQVGTADFYLHFRADHQTFGSSTTVKMGLWNSSTAAEDLYFRADKATTTFWQAMNNSTVLATSTVTAGDAAWHNFEIIRNSGVVTFLIDGVSVYSGAFSTNIAGGPQIKCSAISTSGNVTISYDRIRGLFEVS